MSSVKLVVSDLHLADGSSILECFGERQQAAFAALLHSQVGNVELIINGDCFDFLVTPPYDLHGVTDVPTALLKLEKIITAHEAFFVTLRSFVERPEHRITFITGNHDIELCFVEVRERICQVIVGKAHDPRIYFCPTRFYCPLPDVHIEHGNHYDFWNHAIEGLWDEHGQPLTIAPQRIKLSVGSHYFQHAAHPVSLKYAYFDHFEPSFNIMRQLAILSLLDPQIIVQTAYLTAHMMSYPRKALADLAPGEERDSQRLFEQALLDFAAFQQDMMTQKTDWKPITEDAQISEAILEFASLRDALSLPFVEAIASICTPVPYQMGESVARGMAAVLENEPNLRYAIAGHTHMERIDKVSTGRQVYLNTASWTTRFAPPLPDEITAPQGRVLLDWLRAPDWRQVPLCDVTQFIFALITTSGEGSSHAHLYAWEGGENGHYRPLDC